jgi:hypothetical protein
MSRLKIAHPTIAAAAIPLSATKCRVLAREAG